MANQAQDESVAPTKDKAEPAAGESAVVTERKDVFVRSEPSETSESYVISMRDVWREMNIYTRLTEMLSNLTPELPERDESDEPAGPENDIESAEAAA